MPARINREVNPAIITTRYAIYHPGTGAWRNGCKSIRTTLAELAVDEIAMWYDPLRGWRHIQPTRTQRALAARV